MRRSLPLAIIGVVLILAIGGGVWFFRLKQLQQPSQTSPIIPIVETTPAPKETPAKVETPVKSETSSVPEPASTATSEKPVGSVPESLHIRGGATARVTLEEYGDFQCAPCGRLYPVVKGLEHDYGDRLRVVFRHMPLKNHEHAQVAARAAEAAGLQGRFWEMHNILYENALRWTKGVDTVGPEATPSRRVQSTLLAMDVEVRDVFFQYARILQLDVDRFKQDLDSDPVKERVDSDRKRGLGLGIDRTPTIYVNGNLIPAPSSLSSEGLHAAIDAALAGKVFVPPPAPTPTPTPGVKSEPRP